MVSQVPASVPRQKAGKIRQNSWLPRRLLLSSRYLVHPVLNDPPQRHPLSLLNEI